MPDAEPSFTASSVVGVVREIILEVAARSAVSCRVTALALADMARADEVFVCNPVIGIYGRSLG